MMKPFQVSEKQPELSFGMALSLWTNGVTKQITAICVTGVKPGPDAEKVGTAFIPGLNASTASPWKT